MEAVTFDLNKDNLRRENTTNAKQTKESKRQIKSSPFDLRKYNLTQVIRTQLSPFKYNAGKSKQRKQKPTQFKPSLFDLRQKKIRRDNGRQSNSI